MADKEPKQKYLFRLTHDVDQANVSVKRSMVEHHFEAKTDSEAHTTFHLRMGDVRSVEGHVVVEAQLYRLIKDYTNSSAEPKLEPMEAWSTIEGFTNFEVLMNGLNPPKYRKRIPIDHPDGYKYTDPVPAEEAFLTEILRLRGDNLRLKGLAKDLVATPLPTTSAEYTYRWEPVEGFPEYEIQMGLNPPRFRRSNKTPIGPLEVRQMEEIVKLRHNR